MDCGKTDRVAVELLSGHAEIFGTEMVAHNKYQVTFLVKANFSFCNFSIVTASLTAPSVIITTLLQFQRGAKFAVFTFQGCRVQVASLFL